MKLIIAGTRTVRKTSDLDAAIARWLDDGNPAITQVVSGNASGADQLGEQWALARGIPIAYFPVDWRQHGRAAGPIRNRQMADYADGLIALWDGRSPGTKNMIHEARLRGLVVLVHRIDQVDGTTV